MPEKSKTSTQVYFKKSEVVGPVVSRTGINFGRDGSIREIVHIDENELRGHKILGRRISEQQASELLQRNGHGRMSISED